MQTSRYFPNIAFILQTNWNPGNVCVFRCVSVLKLTLGSSRVCFALPVVYYLHVTFLFVRAPACAEHPQCL